MVTRAELVREARRWIHTPFRHQGRLLFYGVDCVGLVLCVARDLGLGNWLSEFGNYSAQPVNDEVLLACRQKLYEKAASQILPGDVLVFRVPISACHAAFATGRGIVHAYSSVGRVVECGFDLKWRRRLAGVFSIPGVE